MDKQLFYSFFRLSRVSSILGQTQRSSPSLPLGASALLAVVARAYGRAAAPIAARHQRCVVSYHENCLAPLSELSQPPQTSLSGKQFGVFSSTALSHGSIHCGGTACFSTGARPGILENQKHFSGTERRNSAEIPSTSGRTSEGTERHQPPKAGLPRGKSESKSSIDASEVAKFAAMADSW